MTKSQLGVAEDLHKAFWDIDFNSGERYRFGKVKFTGSQIREDYLQNLVPFHQGDYYNSRFGRAEPPFVRHQLVQLGGGIPDFNDAKENKIFAVGRAGDAAHAHTVETGIGYSTDVGPRVKGTGKALAQRSRA